MWVAEHLALTTNVAVKLIDPELAKKESARERFRREATAAAQLRSAHVVQILDHGIDGDQPFIVMELLDGEDLFERLSHRGRIPLREASKVVTQVGRALSRAHQANIVHRDLKPENVFLVPNEDDEIVKVLDFGVAKVNEPNKATMQRTGVGTLIGTPHYMSPEQVKGISEVDSRTDLWALGVIAYQCVTGELPFDSEGVGDLLIKITMGEIPVPSKVLPTLPASFDAWFLRACERDVTKRFQSARELALALAAVVSSESSRSGTGRPPRPLSARPGDAAPSNAPIIELPALPRLPLESLDPSDLEELMDLEPRGMLESTEIDFDDEPDTGSRFSHVEFPLLVRAGTKTGVPELVRPPSEGSGEVPSADVPATLPAAGATTAPAAANSASTSLPAATAAPPERSSTSTGAKGVTPVPPRPTPEPTANRSSGEHESQPASPKAPQSGPRTTVSGFSRPRLLSHDPPPELDGSKRKRLVRLLIAGLILGALGVTWTVVWSQMHGVPSGGPATPPSAPETAPSNTGNRPIGTTTTTTTAVDPGKASRPRPTPTPSTKGKGRSPRHAPDETIEIPNGPDDSVPPAP